MKALPGSPEIAPLPCYLSPWQVLAHWDPSWPLCFLGGKQGRYALLATDFYEVGWDAFLKQSLWEPPQAKQGQGKRALPWSCGYLGLVSYDDFDLAVCPASGGGLPSRVLRIAGGLVFDQLAKQTFKISQGPQPSEQLLLPMIGERWQLTSESFAALCKIAEEGGQDSPPPSAPGIGLLPLAPANSYLAACREAIAQIARGRFYQINLLRYFDLAQGCSRPWLLSRLQEFGGPFCAWLELADLALASFSPERFVRLEPSSEGLKAICQPIKGTMPRSSLATEDAAARQALAVSAKDHAELHMIVDLMRNDLQRISQRRSVTVEASAAVHSYPSVHHLMATVSSYLQPHLTWNDFFSALCPGGSITGAPKVEVMQAIREFEQRRRGYYMGHIFYASDCGSFDASILIRTLVAQEGRQAGQGRFAYAAGSGIVLASKPQLELEEIAAKCRVITS